MFYVSHKRSARDSTLSRSDIGEAQFIEKEKQTQRVVMTKKQLNKEYEKTMLEAEEAVGRKDAVHLLHKADRIRKKLYQVKTEPSTS